jgi:hypothetical protein
MYVSGMATNILYNHRQNCPFLAKAFLRIFCQFLSNFYFFGFNSSSFLQPRSSTLRPTPNVEDLVSVFTFPRAKVTKFYFQAPDSLSIAF